MNRYPLTVASAALAAGFQLASSTAFAHIELQAPLNRYSDIKMGDNKACPCGSGTTNRSCRKPEELSDPDRATDRATTFAPGATVTVRFDEYVGHGGRYRIAFDPDGADLDDFNDHILLDEPDPAGKVGNMGQGSLWQFQVKLPNMTCDNCTLQLIQVMDGNTTDPVLNPVDRGGTYFQCADIVLANGAPLGGLPPADPTDHLGQRGRSELAAAPAMMASTGSDATGGMMVATGSNTGSGTGPAALPAVKDSTPTPNMDAAAEESGGCSLRGAAPGGGWPRDGWSGLIALSSVLLVSGSRARRRQRG